jgi:hypothetical protein
MHRRVASGREQPLEGDLMEGDQEAPWNASSPSASRIKTVAGADVVRELTDAPRQRQLGFRGVHQVWTSDG